MNNFVDRLGAELDRAIQADVARASTSRWQSMRTRSRAAVLTAGSVGIGGVCAAVFLTSGAGPATASTIPILDQAPSGGVQAERLTGERQRAGLEFSATRTFSTSRGPGYVVPAPSRNELCLILSDSGGPKSAGVTCKSLPAAERSGITASLIAIEGSPENSELVVVLPKGAHDVTLTPSGGDPRPVDVDRGVLTVDAEVDTVASWRNETNELQRAAVQSQEPAGQTFFACGNGRKVPIPAGKSFDPKTACEANTEP